MGDDAAPTRRWTRVKLGAIVVPGEFVVVTLPEVSRVPAAATVREVEGVTHVFERSVADSLGLTYAFVAGWITLTLESDLADVGLTALVTGALADAGIACNVLAGAHHDHLLVPVASVRDALAVLDRCTDGG